MERTDRSLDESEQAVLEEYYAGELSLDAVADTLGEDVAVRVFLLKRSIERPADVPAPKQVDIPSDEEFYGDTIEKHETE